MCRHNWIPLIPVDQDIPEGKHLEFAVDMIGKSFYYRCLYCTECGKTGHRIRSRRGGVKVHYYDSGNYFLIQANKIREKFGWPILKNLNLNITE